MILQKPYAREKSGSLRPKMLSANQTALFLDHQYLCKKSSDILVSFAWS